MKYKGPWFRHGKTRGVDQIAKGILRGDREIPKPLITAGLTAAQRNVIDAIKCICGYDDWQFKNHSDGVSVVIYSCPELGCTLKPDGTLGDML